MDQKEQFQLNPESEEDSEEDRMAISPPRKKVKIIRKSLESFYNIKVGDSCFLILKQKLTKNENDARIMKRLCQNRTSVDLTNYGQEREDHLANYEKVYIQLLLNGFAYVLGLNDREISLAANLARTRHEMSHIDYDPGEGIISIDNSPFVFLGDYYELANFRSLEKYQEMAGSPYICVGYATVTF